MRYADHVIISEAKRKAEAFECEVRRAHLLAQVPKGSGWREVLTQRLLLRAGRLRCSPRAGGQANGKNH